MFELKTRIGEQNWISDWEEYTGMYVYIFHQLLDEMYLATENSISFDKFKPILEFVMQVMAHNEFNRTNSIGNGWADDNNSDDEEYDGPEESIELFEILSILEALICIGSDETLQLIYKDQYCQLFLKSLITQLTDYC